MLVKPSADERLRQLGFELVKRDDLVCYLVYENPIDDHCVELDYDGKEWFIHSGSMSKIKDYGGVEIREPMGMKYEECKVFLDKIDEMKSTWEITIREIYKPYYERKD